MFKNKEGYCLTINTYDSEKWLIKEEYRDNKAMIILPSINIMRTKMNQRL